MIVTLTASLSCLCPFALSFLPWASPSFLGLLLNEDFYRERIKRTEVPLLISTLLFCLFFFFTYTWKGEPPSHSLRVKENPFYYIVACLEVRVFTFLRWQRLSLNLKFPWVTVQKYVGQISVWHIGHAWAGEGAAFCAGTLDRLKKVSVKMAVVLAY